MKTTTRTLLTGLGIILITNVIALAGVAYNHSGEPDAVVELTERELRLPYRYVSTAENSGIALSLEWRAPGRWTGGVGYYGQDQEETWLTKEKLAELGFDVGADAQDEAAKRRYLTLLPRPVFVALEYDGDAYQTALANQQRALTEAEALAAQNPDKQEFINRVKRAKERLASEKDFISRLFAIDAAVDKESLRQRYPDRSRYVILSGEVALTVTPEGELSGYIARLDGVTVNVPLQYHALFAPMERDNTRNQSTQAPPRYTVRLAYGQRLEPWILDASPIKQP